MLHNNKSKLFFLSFLFLSTISFSQSIPDNSIKKNIVPITNATEILTKLEPKKYEYDVQKYKHLKFEKGIHYGFLAENMQQAFPELVTSRNVSYMYSKNNYRNTKIKTIEEESLIPVLVASIKELSAEINKLKVELEALKQRK
jgi:Chaperone of endosialidase